MNSGCIFCNWRGEIRRRIPEAAYYKCHKCKQPITQVDVSPWRKWIEQRADEMEAKRKEGEIGTRRQSMREPDLEISVAGCGAELAACIILCPWRLRLWMKEAMLSRENRGCDFPSEWFVIDKPIEIKHTKKGKYLIVRPPCGTPGMMQPEHINDSLYVLMTGTPYMFTAVGWVDKNDFLLRKSNNPIPVRGYQRDCWGVHRDMLQSMKSLFTLLRNDRHET